MIRHDQPPLLITSEDTAVADAIRKGECALGGRLNSDPMSNGYQQSLIDRGTVAGVVGGRIVKSGEGTRGGHVIGHTKSGKPIYGSLQGGGSIHSTALADKYVKETAHFSPQDHADAASAHKQAAGPAMFPNPEHAKHNHHTKLATFHESKMKKSEERPTLSKAIFVLTGMDHYDAPRPENAVLKDTHGEQFSSDADKEVVNYLTTVEKINLDASPAHNPWGQPAFHGFPTVQKSTAVTDALDSICKSGFASLASPMTNAIPKKAHVDVSVPKVSAVKTPKMAVKAPATPKSLASARPVKAPKAGAKIGGKNLTAKSEADIDLYVMAFQ